MFIKYNWCERSDINRHGTVPASYKPIRIKSVVNDYNLFNKTKNINKDHWNQNWDQLPDRSLRFLVSCRSKACLCHT